MTRVHRQRPAEFPARAGGRWARGTVLAALLVGAPGCVEAPVPAEVTLTEEDGVPVVVNTGSAGAVSGIRLREVYSVGLRDDEPTFEYIVTAKVRDDGSVLVADANGGQVYVLNPDGTVRHLVGREGEGPGEYTWLDGAVWGGGDTVFVQSGGGRLTTFDGAELVEARRAGWGWIFDNRIAMELAVRRADGAFEFVHGGSSPQGTGGWLSAPYLRMAPDLERLDTVALFDGVFDMRRGDRNPIDRWGGAWPTGDGFVTARNDVPEVRWHDRAGAVLRIARWDHVPQEMTAEQMDDLARRQMERGSREITEEQLARSIANQRRDLDGPLPIWRRILAAGDGTVWLTDYGDHALDFGGRARVIAPDGTWLGEVDTADRTILMDVTDRWVVGVQYSPLDIQSVILWEIDRPRGVPAR